MVTIYTTPSCSSCRKAKKWLVENEISYKEVNMYNEPITKGDIINILDNTEEGFEDIISKRSKIISSGKYNVDEMTTSELFDLIVENPSVLRRPIIIEEKKLQVGYNEDEIRVFVPEDKRDMSIRFESDYSECEGCETEDCDCDYTDTIIKSITQ